jgi:hypothetical protein
VGEPNPGLGGERRLPTAVIYLGSALVLAIAISVASAFSLGTRTTYGNGVSQSVGSQAQRDFLADQDAEAAALSKGEQSLLSGALTENALVDVNQQIADEIAAGAPPVVTFQALSMNILQATDPADPSLTVEVQEDGTKTVTTQADQNSAPTTRSLAFHGTFWLRKGGSGRYQIADQQIQIQPASPLPAIGLVATALVAVAIVIILASRLRARQAALQPAPGLAATVMAVTTPAPARTTVEPIAAQTQALIKTFGGLHVRGRDGQDWSTTLNARSLTAFVWLRLLVAAIQDPGRPVARDQLGREASPNLDRETQLKQVRNTIQRLRELPPALGECIRVLPQTMSFDLSGRQVDAVDLLEVAKQSAGRTILGGMLLARAQEAIESSSGVFLPEFESVEDLATGRHPTCTELIQGLRAELVAKRLGLIGLVADSHLQAGRAAEAVDLLEPAFQANPDQAALRARLINAYVRAGRADAAAGLEVRQA